MFNQVKTVAIDLAKLWRMAPPGIHMEWTPQALTEYAENLAAKAGFDMSRPYKITHYKDIRKVLLTQDDLDCEDHIERGEESCSAIATA
jgi:hypothetical protein